MAVPRLQDVQWRADYVLSSSLNSVPFASAQIGLSLSDGRQITFTADADEVRTLLFGTARSFGTFLSASCLVVS